MRSLTRVYSDMHSQCAPLDERLVAVGTLERAFICVNALMPREVRSTAKRLFQISNPMKEKRIGNTHLCTALPIAGERSCLLLIGMLHIDQLKNVHSFIGCRSWCVSNARPSQGKSVVGRKRLKRIRSQSNKEGRRRIIYKGRNQELLGENLEIEEV